MIILAADTTSPHGSVALLEKKRLLTEINTDSGLTHSERLLPAVEFILSSQGLSVQDVDGYALAVGPGSFTGIRIGLSTFKSLASASEKPVAPVSTLKALAVKLMLTQGRLLCPVIDAKKSEIYAALYETREGKLQEAIPQGLYSPAQFLARLPLHRIIHFLGTGVEVYKEMIVGHFSDKARFSSRSLFIASEVGRIGYGVIKEKKGMNYLEIEPLYFRRSQAEEKH
jgi:tRNA threonylcarbamoyladenosine biosynthesis protein TsaB